MYYVVFLSFFCIQLFATFFIVQVFLGPGSSGSATRVWVQVLEVANLKYWSNQINKMNASETTDLNHTESFKHIISWDQFQLLTFKNFNHSPSIKKQWNNWDSKRYYLFLWEKATFVRANPGTLPDKKTKVLSCKKIFLI